MCLITDFTDFSNLIESLTFGLEGPLQQCVFIEIVDDNLCEEQFETFFIVAQGGDFPLGNTVTVNIVDNEGNYSNHHTM